MALILGVLSGSPGPTSRSGAEAARRRLHQADQDDHRADRVLRGGAGIAGAGDLKKVGRVGVKAVIYFEVVTTFALCSASCWPIVFQPGVGMNIDPSVARRVRAGRLRRQRVSEVKATARSTS